MIYVACPYTDPSEAIMHRRYEATLRYCAHLVKLNDIPYSPIVHFHEMARHFDLPRDHAYWARVNTTMLRKSDSLHVLCLPGYAESRGVTQERQDADIMYLHTEFVPGEVWWNCAELTLRAVP